MNNITKFEGIDHAEKTILMANVAVFKIETF